MSISTTKIIKPTPLWEAIEGDDAQLSAEFPRLFVGAEAGELVPYAGNISETGQNWAIVLEALASDAQEGQEPQPSPTTSSPSAEVSPASTEAAPSSEAATQADPSNQVILIVEDTMELAEIIQATLESLGYKTVHTTHGKQGLELIKSHKPFLVMLDITLPDITGWQFLDGLKKHYTETQSDVPKVIVLTAHSDPANKLVGKLQNVHTYLVKPVLPDQLERALKTLTSPNPQ